MSPTWRYHAAKRSRKLRDFALMYGANPDSLVTTNKIAFTHADYAAIEKRILAHMHMPRDRVRFNLQPYGLDQPTRNAFHKAFGAPFPSHPMGDTVIIVCRPSQFARFMIYRNDFGGKNSFKELNPVLFTPEAQKPELDVSGNPA